MSRVRTQLRSTPLDVAALLAEAGDAAAGAVLSFVGAVRNEKGGRRVLGIGYEAYVPMAERVLCDIAAEVARRWPVRAVLIEHRIGELAVGDASVAIVLSTPHRAEGFAALRFAIEALKQDVPIWKRERFEDGDVWVQEGS